MNQREERVTKVVLCISVYIMYECEQRRNKVSISMYITYGCEESIMVYECEEERVLLRRMSVRKREHYYDMCEEESIIMRYEEKRVLL